MRKLAFRYRRIKDIYNNYRIDIQSKRLTKKKKKNQFLNRTFRFTWSTKI
jgi:hypothetical protein